MDISEVLLQQRELFATSIKVIEYLQIKFEEKTEKYNRLRSEIGIISKNIEQLFEESDTLSILKLNGFPEHLYKSFEVFEGQNLKEVMWFPNL